MSITLTTGPAWSRTADHSFYGGNVNKTDYLSQGVVDPLTDVGASDLCRLAADVAALVRTAPFCVITYTCNDSSPAAPTVHSCFLMTGVSTSNYAGDTPPTGFPSLARNGNGDITITFAASYSDDYGTAAAFVARNAGGSVHGSVGASISPDIVTSVTVRLRALNHANAAVSDAKVTAEIS